MPETSYSPNKIGNYITIVSRENLAPHIEIALSLSNA